jgi:hypothetical protein
VGVESTIPAFERTKTVHVLDRVATVTGEVDRLQMKLLWVINVGFDITDQLLIRSFAFVRYWRKKLVYKKTVHQLFVDFKKAYDSVRREILYNIIIDCGVPM